MMICVMNRTLPYLMSDGIVLNRASVEFLVSDDGVSYLFKMKIWENVLQTFFETCVGYCMSSF